MMERSSIDPKTSVLVKVFRDCTSSASSAQSNFDGSAHQNFHGSGNDVYSGLEVWKLNDVVFLDDSPSILGRVVAIDNNQVVVDCSYTQSDPSEGHPSDVPVAKSSLKVFRLSDLEPCIEGPDFFSRQGANVTEEGPSTSSCQPPQRMASRHVAGVVQHRPVCIVEISSFSHVLTSAILKSLGSSIPEPISQSETPPLNGFRALAVHCTDAGPNLLVERVADRKSFLLCSAHLDMSGTSGTSFVAVGSTDDKHKRVTILEEAVDSVESGLSPNKPLSHAIRSILLNRFQTSLEPGDSATSADKPEGGGGRGRDKGTKSKSASRKGKTVTFAGGAKGSSDQGKRSAKPHSHEDETAMDTSTGSASAGSYYGPKTVTNCEFVPLLPEHPDMCFLRDFGGTVWPLSDGLSLQPTPPGGPNGANSGPKGPMQSYRCICVRQYAIQGQDQDSVAVLALGKQNQNV